MADENVNETEAAEETPATTPEAETTEAPAAEAVETPAAEAAADDAADSSSDTSEGTSEGTSDEDAVDLEALKAMVAKPAKDARYQATGKRKTSVARVILTPGTGFWINGRTLEDYFNRARDRDAVIEPLVAAGADASYHVRARIHGGGITGQTGALRHGISKALADIDPALRSQLKGKGFLKVDTRQVERKKAGLKKARKKPQFSKR